MNFNELTSMLEKMDTILNACVSFPTLHLRLQMLKSDIETNYRDHFRDLSGHYRNAWDQVVLDRLDSFPPPPGTVTRSFMDLRTNWRTCATGASIRILFGQMRVGPVFQSSMNVQQQTIPGFPQQIVGRPLQVIRGMFRDGSLLSDQIPLQIFLSKSGQWVAANNRCYTAHCLAGVKPIRVIPRVAEQPEINRFAEVEGEGDVGRLTMIAGARLLRQPRTLPSDQMPITDGPNSWSVIAVATVPDSW